MSVRIHLDNPSSFYTNLDFISGKIVLSLSNAENISAVVVKLEGESKTILAKPTQPNRDPSRSRVEIAIENHKILYKVEQVWPKLDTPGGKPSGMAYTLPPGQHEYPFRFKIPFNNMCADPQLQTTGIGFGGIRLMDIPAQLLYRHVTQGLPPSLSGFPGEAEIRYYIKVTVQRPSLFKENRRSEVGFKFLPIEPPRAAPSSAETYARRPHTFKPGLAGYAKKSSMFKKTAKPLSATPPSFTVDARLPSPAILTCNQSLPLRLLVKKEATSPEWAYLMALQVDLLGTTHVRAQDVARDERQTWTILSLGTLSLPIVNPNDPVGKENLIDKSLWDQIRLPSTITPSFQTCNLSRSYELEVRVIVGYGLPGDIQPQTQLLPLRFPVEVYSGIAPPPALINAMASRPPRIPARPPVAPSIPVQDPAYPPQLGTAAAAVADEAPPSYEDAMADEIGPVDGRREYSGVTNENEPSIDGAAPGYSAQTNEKSGNSGRLFPGSGPGPKPGSGSGGFVV